MQHKKALQRESDKRWDYTVQWGDRITPIGYCRPFKDPDEMGVPMNPDTAATIRQFKDKHHSHGHETAEEACNCYKEYLLDQRLRHGELDNQMVRCQVCGEWTQHVIYLDGYVSYKVCEKHATREELEKLVSVWESWES